MSDSGSSLVPRVSFACPALCLAPLPPPSLPPTLRDVDVPPLFRDRFVRSGYRPVGVAWRCYVLSLFQIHNETVNVWSPLLAAVCVAMRFTMFAVLQGGGILGFRLQGPEGQGFSVDASSLPLVLYAVSAVTHLSCSAGAHLLQSHSDPAHHSLVFLDCVGVAVYQYGCALALCVYTPDSTWKQSMLGQVFLPAAAVLAWLSSATCCWVELHFHQQHPLHRKLCQVMPMGAAYLLNISPVAHRLATCSWPSGAALPLHVLQVVLFPLSAFFFSCPIPECFAPGLFDFIGRSHQLFHILLAVCTLVQQEALFQDFLWRRPAVLREFGEAWLLMACASFPCLMVCCGVTAHAGWRRRRG
ncbi:membrane progestin receptor beta-like [Brachionichthys hirsutus]|uniref:membrane progestin receptor beta-like n=1 Tax=Brachionichthys hirsutus TaxID=412623 RepID=UPI003604E08D